MNGVTLHSHRDKDFPSDLRRSLRATATCMSLLTTRGDDGRCFARAVTNPTPLSPEPATMAIAVGGNLPPPMAGGEGHRYCLSLLSRADVDLLDILGASDLDGIDREPDLWRMGPYRLPYLANAAASYFCRVIGAHGYGSHTIFVGRIEDVRVNANIDPRNCDPLIWLNGGPLRLAGRGGY